MLVSVIRLSESLTAIKNNIPSDLFFLEQIFNQKLKKIYLKKIVNDILSSISLIKNLHISKIRKIAIFFV